MVLLWLLIGVVVVSIAFFIPGNSADLWPSLNAAGIAAAVYLFALFVHIFRRPISVKGRVIGLILVVVVAASVVTVWLGMHETTHWQASQLQKIHTVINRGILQTEIPDSLVAVLQDYHKQGRIKNASLGKIFLKKFPGATIGTNIHQSYMMSQTTEVDKDSLRVFVTLLSDTMIAVTGTHAFSRGRDPDFISFMGRKGTVQERYILTEKGVRHESDN
jgi:hypothetical protein